MDRQCANHNILVVTNYATRWIECKDIDINTMVDKNGDKYRTIIGGIIVGSFIYLGFPLYLINENFDYPILNKSLYTCTKDIHNFLTTR